MVYKPVIGITMGDPSGVGPEIIIKLICDARILSFCRPVVIGDPDVMHANIAKLEANIELVLTSEADVTSLENIPGAIQLIPVQSDEPCAISWGKADAAGGRLSKLAIDKAVELALKKHLGAIVTAPINKKAVNMAGFRFSGHTEYLAKLTNTQRYAMMLAGGGLRVILVTTHNSLKEVPSLISKDAVLEKIEIAHKSGLFFGLCAPKIAVCSLNPHASDGGIFGSEETDEISPAVREAVAMGIDTEGPIASDTLFSERHIARFDMVVAMYHDQGLIPLKMKSFGSAVNITLGLPIIRTSVDHGTAYDIAGCGQADTGSLYEAILAASQAYKYRRDTSSID